MGELNDLNKISPQRTYKLGLGVIHKLLVCVLRKIEVVTCIFLQGAKRTEKSVSNKPRNNMGSTTVIRKLDNY